MRQLLLLLIIVTSFGCASIIVAEPPSVVEGLLPFLQDGVTSKEAVQSSLGRASWSFEKGRILAYRMARAVDGRVAAIGWDEIASDELILTFDDRDVLRRHSLLRVR
jgi:hypothetical protein